MSVKVGEIDITSPIRVEHIRAAAGVVAQPAYYPAYIAFLNALWIAKCLAVAILRPLKRKGGGTSPGRPNNALVVLCYGRLYALLSH